MLVPGLVRGDHVYGLLALDEYLVGDSESFADLEHLVVVLVALVHVHAYTVLAAAQGLLEGRHFHRIDGDVVGPVKREHLNLGISEIAYQRALVRLVPEHLFEVGATEHVAVVGEYQDGVLGHLEIQFHHICAHTYDGFYGADGVLREVAPVATVTDHHHIFGLGIVDLVHNHLGAVSVLRAFIAGKGRKKDQCR